MRLQARNSEVWQAFVRNRRGEESRAGFAARCHVSNAYVSNWEHYGQVPSRDLVIRAATALGDDPLVWLIAAGYEERAAPPELERVAPAEKPVESQPVPVRGAIVDYGEIRLVANPARWGTVPVEYVVRTDTLEPEFRRGDRLVFSPTVAPEEGDRVILATRRGEQFCRFVGESPTGGILVGPPHASIPAEPSEVKDARLLGTLIDARRRYRAEE